MPRLILLAAAIAILFLSVPGGRALAAQDKSIAGNWLGTIAVNGIELRIGLAFTIKSGGAYSGTFQSLDQGAQTLPLDSVTVNGNSVAFTLKIASGSWSGELNTEGTELSGTWSQGASSLPLNFKKQAGAPKTSRWQDPVAPFPYTQVEVLYPNKTAGFNLGGTLTIPQGKRPFPAVLLITGSGQQDRNESLLGHRPFLVIADYLTRRGIAVLRVDDRGIGKSGGNFAASTTADFVTDVQSGIAFLRSRPEIDSARIGLAGHSEGGIIAPAVAAADPKIAFIVLLAGTGVNGASLLLAQQEAIGRAMGTPDQAIAATRASNKALFDIVVASKDAASSEAAIRKVAEAQAAQAKAQGADPAAVDQAVNSAIATMNSPWMRYFLKYDPAPALQKVKCPVLALNGSKDRQVPPQQNLPAIKAALTAGGNKDFKVVELEGLNHLFQTCTTGAPSEYGKIEETFSRNALKVMADWIIAHVISGRNTRTK